MPWKNGGGETAEIAIAPPGAKLEDFDWRVSMARVDGDGPFSSFPGVERTLTVLTGAGMRLRVAGREAVDLSPDSEPYAFSADVATGAELLGGPITDFNVMTRRGRVAHRVERMSQSTIVTSPAHGRPTLVFCIAGQLLARCPTGTCVVGPLDSLLVGPEDEAVRIAPDPGASFLLVEIGAT